MDRTTLINMITQYELLTVEQRNRLIMLKMFLLDGNNDAADSVMRDFAKENENIYLKLKSLIYEAVGRKTNTMAEQLGTTDDFPSSLTEIRKGVWKFHLPPFYSVSAKRKVFNEGKHVYYLVMNLQNEYEKKHKKIRKMEKPLVIFRHHICSETGRLFDYDNIDSKRAIDAMQGYFLKDDNAVYLTTVHDAVTDPEGSYCDIFVTDRAKNSEVFISAFAEILN